MWVDNVWYNADNIISVQNTPKGCKILTTNGWLKSRRPATQFVTMLLNGKVK